nr:hypothetical protein [Tanacetum cinerariifolium]
VGAAHGPALAGEGGRELRLHRLLGRPALLVGGQAQIAAGEQEHFGLRGRSHVL